jgi:L-methionine (R)-S-oxide reductase
MNHTFEQPPVGDKEEMYKETIKQLESLLADDDDLIAILANASALLKLNFRSFSWVGFYLLQSNRELVVGPFQGKPACVRIELGKGVCGAAAQRNETIVVEDVERFAGHIACDPMSRSEIVIPVQHAGAVVGVLDVDSESLANFDQTDRDYLEKVAALVGSKFRRSRGIGMIR